MINWILKMTTILLCASVVSAQRSVGGGGIAEIQTLNIHQNLYLYLEPCLTNANICGLSMQDQLDWRELNRRHRQDVARIKIDFNDRQSNEIFNIIFPDKIIFASSALYSGERPLPPNELAAIVATSRWMLLRPRSDVGTLIARSRQAFRLMTTQHQTYRMLDTKTFLEVHVFGIAMGGQRTQMVLLEDKNKTYDLIPALSGLARCPNPLWGFSNWRGTGGRGEYYFISDVLQVCQNQRINNHLIVNVVTDLDGLIIQEKIKIQLRR